MRLLINRANIAKTPVKAVKTLERVSDNVTEQTVVKDSQ